MHHLAVRISVCLLATAAGAQCFTATGAPVTLVANSSSFAANDEGRTAELALGFTFPMAGVGAVLSHCVVDANGEIYLTDGSGVVGPSNFGISNLTEMRGGAGGSPRVVAMGGDNAGVQPSSRVLVDTSVAGQFKVTFVDWSIWNLVQSWDVSMTLCQNGEIQFDYSSGFAGTNFGDFAGVSIGNDVGSPSEPASDLAAGGNSGALGLIYDNVWTTPIDLANSSLRFVPNGLGGYSYAVTCQITPASHESYGAGCYRILPASATQACYQLFLDAAGSQALQGTSITCTPNANGNGYVISSGGGSYVAPTAAATDLLLGDDGQANVTPSTPFPHVDGPVPILAVCANGYVSMAAAGVNSPYAYGSVPLLLTSPAASFRSNADYDPSAGGAVEVEEVADVLYVTWKDVVRYGGVDAERFQLQFELNTGVVRFVWDLMTSVGSGDLVVGYAPDGPSLDPGSIVLATALPITTSPELIIEAMSMSASPAPIVTALAGATVVYQIDDIPDANVNSGIHVGVTVLSLTADVPGTGLSGLGMPGCSLHVGGLDFTLSFFDLVGNSSNTTSFIIPAGVPAGTEVFAQSVALVVPNSLPNGQNAFGAVVSNALRSYISWL